MTHYRATVRIEITDDSGRITAAAERYARHVGGNDPSRLHAEAQAAITTAMSGALESLDGERVLVLPPAGTARRVSVADAYWSID